MEHGLLESAKWNSIPTSLSLQTIRRQFDIMAAWAEHITLEPRIIICYVRFEVLAAVKMSLSYVMMLSGFINRYQCFCLCPGGKIMIMTTMKNSSNW